MHARFAPLALLAALGCHAGTVVDVPTESSATAPAPLAHERFVLQNGLEVVLHEDHRMPLVAMNLRYHVGSMHDGPNRGMAHLVEHLMFRGTTHVRDGGYFRSLETAGAVAVNAATYVDRTEYYAVVATDHLPLLLWHESERMGNIISSLTHKHVAEEVTTTKDEWRMRVAGSSYGLAMQESVAAVYPADHPYYPATPPSMSRLKLRQATEFLRRYYGPANATLVLAGDLPEDTKSLVTRLFAERKGGQRPTEPATAVAPITEQRTAEIESEFATTPLLILIWPSAGYLEPGDVEADVLAEILNTGPFETLMHSPEGEMLLGVEATQRSQPGTSTFIITAQAREGVPPSALLALVDAALADFGSAPVSAAEVGRGIKRRDVAELKLVQSLPGRAARMQRGLADGALDDAGNLDLPHRAVTPSSVEVMWRRQLDTDRRIVLKVHPRGTLR